MSKKIKPLYPFEVLYKGGPEFEENLRMLNAERVREYQLLQKQNPQTEEEFQRHTKSILLMLQSIPRLLMQEA